MLQTEARTAPIEDRVRRLVAIASGGNLTPADLESAGGSLAEVGFDSIGYMNLFESLERSFGVIIDPEKDPSHLTSVGSIVRFLEDQLR